MKTHHNYRDKGIGPPSINYRRRLIYKLADVEAWLAKQLAPPAVDPERAWESRPPEPRRLPKRP
ncbi:hypothetical protein [Streptomyces yanii]|uniref:DNA-binding protein n=1 Tax=Streptomyces yanii TaxID=78510 RepID=A0ABV5RKM3_9ACTN